MDMPKRVAANTARLRQESGLTLDQLADRTGLTRDYLGTLERGDRDPTATTLQKLAEPLGVSAAELLRED